MWHSPSPGPEVNWAKAPLLLVLSASGTLAGTDLANFRPQPRPAELTVAVNPGPAVGLDAEHMIRPMPRPNFDTVVTAQPQIRPKPRPDFAVLLTAAPQIRPMPRPDFTANPPRVQLAALPAPIPQKPPKASLKGSVCQSADVKGKALPPIRSAIQGCNVPDAVLVTQISGVVLNPPATINCEEARALSVWVRNGLQPAFNNTILALNVADSYACRPRNNVRGNPVSVHGIGQAIDIAAFVTKSGRTYTVAQNYNAQIKAAQRSACGTFHTILGPGSDGYHENHIHFDVSHHAGRDYCH